MNGSNRRRIQNGGRLRAGLLAFCITSAFIPAVSTAQEALVTSQLAGEVAFVDLLAGKVTGTVSVDGAPAGIAFSPDRKTAYVTRPEAHSLAVIDVDTRTMTASIGLPGGPLGIAVNPRSGAIYVADWYAERVFVLEVSPQGPMRKDDIAVGKSPSGLAVTPDGRTLLVANREADSVSVIDLERRDEVARVGVGRHPFGLTLDDEGKRAYTANVESNDVSVIDVPAHREIGRIETGERPYVVALAQGRGFVTNQYANSVTVFGLDDLKPVAAIDVDDHPEGIAASRDGKSLYVANWGDNTLSVIDASSLKVSAKIAVPDGPRAFGDFIR